MFPARSEPDAPGVVLCALAGLGLKSAAHVMAAWERRFTCSDGRVSIPFRLYTKAARDDTWRELAKPQRNRLSTAFGDLCAAYYASVHLTPTTPNTVPVRVGDSAPVTCDSAFTRLAKADVVFLGLRGW